MIKHAPKRRPRIKAGPDRTAAYRLTLSMEEHARLLDLAYWLKEPASRILRRLIDDEWARVEGDNSA